MQMHTQFTKNHEKTADVINGTEVLRYAIKVSQPVLSACVCLDVCARLCVCVCVSCDVQDRIKK
jgi:hypothetical protein